LEKIIKKFRNFGKLRRGHAASSCIFGEFDFKTSPLSSLKSFWHFGQGERELCNMLQWKQKEASWK
jgi:hypothetical protein